jgi:hypothetical protein
LTPPNGKKKTLVANFVFHKNIYDCSPIKKIKYRDAREKDIRETARLLMLAYTTSTSPVFYSPPTQSPRFGQEITLE